MSGRSTPTGPAEHFDNLAQQSRAATLGIWLFLATELMFFGPLFFAYIYGRLYFPQAFADAGGHTDVVLGTLNTVILLTSSLCMANAVEAVNAGDARVGRALLLLTASLGVAFLAIKGFEYWQEWQEGLVPGRGSWLGAGGQFFFLLYFAMTGVHAVHLAIGIAAALFFARDLGAGSGAARAARAVRAERVRIAGLYWHFVDAIWVILYPILYLLGRHA